MKFMFCHHCHNETADGSVFCMVCGKKISESDENQSDHERGDITESAKTACLSAASPFHSRLSPGRIPIPMIARLISAVALFFAMILMFFAPIFSIEECAGLYYYKNKELIRINTSAGGSTSFFTLFIYSVRVIAGLTQISPKIINELLKGDPYLITFSIIRLLIFIMTAIVIATLTVKLIFKIMLIVRLYDNASTAATADAVKASGKKSGKSLLCKWICIFLNATMILISGTSIYGGTVFINLMIIALFWISIACEIFVYLQKSKNQTTD